MFSGEGPKTASGCFAIDITEQDASEYYSRNPDTGADEWFIPIEVVNAHFMVRTYRRFEE